MSCRLVLDTNYIRSCTVPEDARGSSSEDSSEYSPTTHSYAAGTQPIRALYKNSPAIGKGKSVISEPATLEPKQYYWPTTVKHNLTAPNPDDCHTYKFTSTGERIVPIPDLGLYPITIPPVPSLVPFYEAMARRADGKGILEGTCNNSTVEPSKGQSTACDEDDDENIAIYPPNFCWRRRSPSDSRQSNESGNSSEESSFFVKRTIRITRTTQKKRMSKVLQPSKQRAVAIKRDGAKRSPRTLSKVGIYNAI